jgi:hypothetical protein
MLGKIVDIVHDRRQRQLQNAIGQHTTCRDEILTLEWGVAVEVCLKYSIAVRESWSKVSRLEVSQSHEKI